VEATQVLNCQNTLGEGPLWHPAEGALYWVDITGKKIQRYFPASGQTEVFDVPRMVSALGLRQSGGFVCAADDGFHFWTPQGNQFEPIRDPETGRQGARFNDGKVDRGGRFWAGSMTPQGASSALYRLDPNLSVHRMVSYITISNGIGWSPDSQTMVYVDSNRLVIYAFDFDLKSGEISRQRDFHRFENHAGVPDGLTVDGEGFIWCALYDGWKVVRIDPDGNIVDEIHMPVSRPSSVAFGGQHLDELYITSIAEGLSPEEMAQQPMAGDLFMVKPGVRGLPEPAFAG
jgi:sugar lactone lactonase YvrE